MAAITIRKIKLKELKSFVESEEYKNFDIIPISKSRVVSYLNNPRADFESYILYMAFINNELVGFRTILADVLFLNNKNYPFGWFSGNWVKPENRRSGISSILFAEVVSDWDSKLLYTNYAPESKALYDKSQEFSILTERTGVRFYFKPMFYALLSHRFTWLKKIKILVLFAETILKVLLYPYLKLSTIFCEKNLKKVEVYTGLNQEVMEYIGSNPYSVFNRTENEFSWISNFPWVKEDADIINYPFSYTAKKYVVNILVSKSSKGEIEGIAIAKNINGTISIPYYSTNNESSSNILGRAIISWAKAQNGSTFTVYNPKLKSTIEKQKCIALFRKKMQQKYFIMSKFKQEFGFENTNIDVQDGDGDVIFT